jgi:hypothetical protein
MSYLGSLVKPVTKRIVSIFCCPAQGPKVSADTISVAATLANDNVVNYINVNVPKGESLPTLGKVSVLTLVLWLPQ